VSLFDGCRVFFSSLISSISLNPGIYTTLKQLSI